MEQIISSIVLQHCILAVSLLIPVVRIATVGYNIYVDTIIENMVNSMRVAQNLPTNLDLTAEDLQNNPELIEIFGIENVNNNNLNLVLQGGGPDVDMLHQFFMNNDELFIQHCNAVLTYLSNLS